MILGYSTPVTLPTTGISYTDTVNTSLAFLKDGRPGALCSLQHTGSSQDLDVSWVAPIRARVAALINTNLPVGYPVQISLRTGGAYTVQTQNVQVVETASGDRCAFVQWDGVAGADGIRFRLNDTVASPVTIGEVWVSDALDYCIRSDWSSAAGIINKNVSLSGAVYTAPAVPRRVVSADIAPRRYEEGFEELRKVSLAVSDDPRVLIAPDAKTQAALESTAMYARVVTNGNVQGNPRGRAFSWSVSAEEMPGRLPA